MTHSPRLTAARLALAAAALAAGAVLAQKIDDVPPAVQNNVAPNFMFMIDNSGSMNNIVPAAPYSATATYLASCASGSQVPAGTSVDLRVVGGAPRFEYGGVVYRHTTVAGSQPARCFSNTASYGARLLADSASGGNREPGSYLDSDYSGHYLNWYFGNYGTTLAGWVDRKLVTTGAVETRIEIARRSARSAVDALPLPATGSTRAAVRAGLSTYRSDSSGGALRIGMGDLDAAARDALKASIDALVPSASTPLATTFADIGRYMATGYNGDVATANTSAVNIDTLLRISGTDNSARDACLQGAPSCTSAASARPIQYWCQRSSLFAMTDGRPQSDRGFNNNPHVRDYDGDCSGLNTGNCVNGGAAGSWDRKTARSYESAGSDYMDDVAKLLFDVDLRPDLLKPTPVAPATRAKNNITTYMIGFADPAVQNDPLLMNTARQGGGKFIAATDGPTLVEAFRSVIADALALDAAAAAVAVTNAQITAGSVGYASSYNSGGWYGDLEAYSLDVTTGLQNGGVLWSARDRITAQAPASRKIASFDGTTGVRFIAANTTTFQITAPTLTAGVINYTRGDRTGEGTTYRARNYLLGDIINAEPVVVNYASGPVVYQAANDGMLHAIDGRVPLSVTTRGQELWAYVPQLVHSKLAERADPVFEHEYLVDGTPATAEITGAAPVARLLVGGLGKGGAGYYALDITSGSAANEAAAAAKVLWEFKPANMGYSFGTPLILNTAAGWKVVLASGYRNDTAAGGLGGDGRGRVWVLHPRTGAVEKEFITPAGFGDAAASLGLAHLGKPNVSAGAAIRYVYGGDLRGNVWRVDLDAATGSTLVRVAAAADPGGIAQPITAAPVVAPVAGSATRWFVYFGTGQYFSLDDVPGTASPNLHATQRQTIYGVVDDTTVAAPALPNVRGTNGATCPAGGGNGDLVCQSATQATAGSPFTATHHPVDTASKRGFYLDIPISGGRVNTQFGLTAGGTLVVVVNKPSNEVCNPGGSSFFFQLAASTGGAVARTFGGSEFYDVGYALADALSSRPVIVITSDGPRAIFRLSDKSTQSRAIKETSGSVFRRIYMRPLG